MPFPNVLPRRPLRRNDIVVERVGEGFSFYGRVWYRIDQNHVVVIDTGKYITVYHEDELDRVDYQGYWDAEVYEDTDEFLMTLLRYRFPVYRRMPSLRKLKQRASYYNPGIFRNREGCLNIGEYQPRYKETKAKLEEIREKTSTG